MNNTADRRVKPRVSCTYPAVIEGIDVDGNRYNEDARLANLSASGLFMKTNRYIEPGLKLSVTVLLTAESIEKDTPKIATNGVVVRVEPQADGSCGVAVKFNSYRFL
jgi:hypothetical protein